jgi:hypothetical protein
MVLSIGILQWEWINSILGTEVQQALLGIPRAIGQKIAASQLSLDV